MAVMRPSRSETCFSESTICWPRPIRLIWDWFSDFSSIRACASAAVRSPMAWLWASLLRSWSFAFGLAAGLADGDGLAAGLGDAGGCDAVGAPGEAEGAALGEAATGAAELDAESAKPGSDPTKRLSPPNTVMPKIATLRRFQRRVGTSGRKLTTVPKSLQLFRRDRTRPTAVHPNRLPPWAPSCPF